MLKLNDKYPDKSTAPSDAYPFGGPKDDPTAALLGTPWEAATAGDFFGLMQAVAKAAGITPSGNTETAQASDFLDSISSLAYYDKVNYKANRSIVTGSNGKQYIAISDNGPKTSVVNPVGDNTDTWRQYPYKEVSGTTSDGNDYFGTIDYKGLAHISIKITLNTGEESKLVNFPVTFPANRSITYSVDDGGKNYGITQSFFGPSKVTINLRKFQDASLTPTDVGAIIELSGNLSI